MNIQDIPYSHIKVFLSINKQELSDDEKLNYDKALKLMKSVNTNYSKVTPSVYVDNNFYGEVPLSIIQ